MKISVFGLGYVGSVSSGCLAEDGHALIGVDPNADKVNLINAGQSPIIEQDIGEIIERNVRSGRLRATVDSEVAVRESELSFVCVGTPSQINGSLDLRHVRKVCEEIGRAIAAKNQFHVVVMRSTMLPGSMRDVVIPALEESSGLKAGDGFGVCINPEFLREGTAVYDFNNPPKTVIGELDARSGDLLASLYSKLSAPLIRTRIEVAELVKYTDNAWHAVKIAFANEIGNLAKELKLDGHAVMDIFCQDTKLNLSKAYLKPGFAFGGSCLPKDLRALTYRARTLDLDLPLLNSVLPSNQRQVERGFHLIARSGKKRVGMLGLSFKAGTDDLRESPLVEIVERLIGKGYDIRIYDRNVSVAGLVGANRDFIFNHIPHISKLMLPTLGEVMEHGEVLVVGNADPEFAGVAERLQPHQSLVDLVRVANPHMLNGRYHGICW